MLETIGGETVDLAVAQNDIDHMKSDLTEIKDCIKDLPCFQCLDRVNALEVQLAEIRTEVNVRSGVVSTLVSLIGALVTYLTTRGQ